MSVWQLTEHLLVYDADVVALINRASTTQLVRRGTAPQMLPRRARTLIQRMNDPQRRFPGTQWQRKQ